MDTMQQHMCGDPPLGTCTFNGATHSMYEQGFGAMPALLMVPISHKVHPGYVGVEAGCGHNVGHPPAPISFC